MKKKLALGIGLVGAALLALSLTVFGMGAAATLNPAAPETQPARAAEPAAVPAAVVAPVSTNIPATSDAAALETADKTDPMTSDAFKAMTPDEQANGREWMETQTITVSCMKEKGYEYTFAPPYWTRGPGEFPPSWESTLPASERAAGTFALWGETGAGADYHWDEAGCWGYAVHVMGNDKNH